MLKPAEAYSELIDTLFADDTRPGFRIQGEDTPQSALIYQWEPGIYGDEFGKWEAHQPEAWLAGLALSCGEPTDIVEVSHAANLLKIRFLERQIEARTLKQSETR